MVDDAAEGPSHIAVTKFECRCLVEAATGLDGVPARVFATAMAALDAIRQAIAPVWANACGSYSSKVVALGSFLTDRSGFRTPAWAGWSGSSNV